MPNNKRTGISQGTAVAVGAGAAALAAAAAGTYWFYGSAEAKRHRNAARSWMLKARADVLEGVENVVREVGEIDVDTYMKIVRGALKHHGQVAKATIQEKSQMLADMKSAWTHMQKARKRARPISSKIVAKKRAKKTAPVSK